MAARRIGHAVDLTSRAARQVLPVRRKLSFVRRERRPEYTQAPHGLIVHQGEVGLDRLTSPEHPAAGPAGRRARRAAWAGAVPRHRREPRRSTPRRIPTPWPDEAREPLFELLSGGPALLPVWESLDLAGCIVRWIPGVAGHQRPAAAQPGPPAHRRPALGAVRRRGAAAPHPGRPPRPAAARLPAARHRQAARARAPRTPRSAPRSPGRSRSRSACRRPTSSWSSGWSAST